MNKHFKLFMILALSILISQYCFAEEAANPNLGAGVFNDIQAQFMKEAQKWEETLQQHALYLFELLSVISLVWTGISLALRRGDMQDFFAEFIRFILFFGFFLWLLQNGAQMGASIINSLTQLGGKASGTGAVTPSEVVQVGFDLWDKTYKSLKDLDIPEKIAAIFMLVGTTMFTCLTAVNFLLLQITAWLYLYSAIFALGFGGSRWTYEIALNYFRQLINLGLQLMVMILMVGVSKSLMLFFIEDIHHMSLFNFVVILIIAWTLFKLSSVIPSMVGSIITGSTGNAGIGTFGGSQALATTSIAFTSMMVAAQKFESAGYKIVNAAKMLNTLNNGSDSSSNNKTGDALKYPNTEGAGRPLRPETLNKSEASKQNSNDPAQKEKEKENKDKNLTDKTSDRNANNDRNNIDRNNDLVKATSNPASDPNQSDIKNENFNNETTISPHENNIAEHRVDVVDKQNTGHETWNIGHTQHDTNSSKGSVHAHTSVNANYQVSFSGLVSNTYQISSTGQSNSSGGQSNNAQSSASGGQSNNAQNSSSGNTNDHQNYGQQKSITQAVTDSIKNLWKSSLDKPQSLSQRVKDQRDITDPNEISNSPLNEIKPAPQQSESKSQETD